LPAGNPVVTGTVISTTWANNTLNDISNEITNSLPRDGTAPPLANIPFGNYKITELGAATLPTDAAQYQQIQSGATNYLTAVAGTDTITANLSSPTLTAYAAGNTFRFIAAGNNTGAVTLNINGLGAKDVTKNGATALIAGDITSSATIEVVYDGTRFQLIGTAKVLNEAQGADIASAATVNLTTATGNYVHITGTTTITAITLAQGAPRTVVFDGALTLTNGASLLLPTGANITTASGDTAVFRGEASSVVRCVSYDRKNGTSLTHPVQNTISQLNTNVTVTDDGTGKVETTIDGTIISEETLAARKSTIDGGSTLYPEFKCRAWVNFNGTGTVAIRESGNVSSITDNGTGDYTVNFTTAMPDANYAVTGAAGSTTEGGYVRIKDGTTPTVGAVNINALKNSGTATSDQTNIYVSIFR
jgi:hypothetical protein